MTYLLLQLQLLGLHVQDRLRGDRGSTTTEIVLWAVAAITLAGIVYAAMNGFVGAQIAKIG